MEIVSITNQKPLLKIVIDGQKAYYYSSRFSLSKCLKINTVKIDRMLNTGLKEMYRGSVISIALVNDVNIDYFEVDKYILA